MAEQAGEVHRQVRRQDGAVLVPDLAGRLLPKLLPKRHFRPLCCVFSIFHVVSRYVQSYVKPGMKMTEICQRLERKTHELVVARLAALETTSIHTPKPTACTKDFRKFVSPSQPNPICMQLASWPGERPGSGLGLPHWSWCLGHLGRLGRLRG